MFIAAQVLEDGVEQSTVFIDDALWASSEQQMRDRAKAKGYALNVLTEVESGQVERNIDDLGAFDEWIATLNPDED